MSSSARTPGGDVPVVAVVAAPAVRLWACGVYLGVTLVAVTAAAVSALPGGCLGTALVVVAASYLAWRSRSLGVRVTGTQLQVSGFLWTRVIPAAAVESISPSPTLNWLDRNRTVRQTPLLMLPGPTARLVLDDSATTATTGRRQPSTLTALQALLHTTGTTPPVTGPGASLREYTRQQQSYRPPGAGSARLGLLLALVLALLSLYGLADEALLALRGHPAHATVTQVDLASKDSHVTVHLRDPAPPDTARLLAWHGHPHIGQDLPVTYLAGQPVTVQQTGSYPWTRVLLPLLVADALSASIWGPLLPGRHRLARLIHQPMA